MVQLTDHTNFGFGWWEGVGLDAYWKLDDPTTQTTSSMVQALNASNFRLEEPVSQERLPGLYTRYQRGLRSYETATLAELKLCIAERGLPVATDQEAKRSSLKAQLERADEEATFDRFLDLPAELRLRIYALYFKSFVGTRAIIRSQPPITGASKLIRKESLPVFYGHCKFQFEIDIATPTMCNVMNARRMEDFLDRTATCHFGLIRTIDLSFVFRRCKTDLSIDLYNAAAPIKAVHRYDNIGGSESAKERMLTELHDFVSSIIAREGDSKLQKNDLDKLHEIVGNVHEEEGVQLA